jgi:putative ABC transport system substrate-binding protein
MVHELVPTVTAIAVLINPKSPQATNAKKDAEAAAQMLGLKVAILNAATSSELGPVFTAIREQAIGALVLQADPLFDSHRDELVALSAQARLPTLFVSREYARAGGLLSYGPILPDIWEQAGIYVGRILAGDKPENLPVQQPTKFELVINLKTAKTLGLTVPPNLLARADEVIE